MARVQGGEGAARRTVALLSSIFTYGTRLGHVSTNPCQGVERTSDKRKEFALGMKGYAALGLDLKKICGAERWQFMEATRLLILTGCRKNEIVHLSWDEVDLPGQMLRFLERPGRTIKGGLIRPICEAAVEVLQKIAANFQNEIPETGPVFPGIVSSSRPYGDFENAWKRRITVPGLNGRPLTPHLLRHSYASLAGELGFNELVIADLLGHSRKRSVTSGYVKLDEIVMNAANTVAHHIVAAMKRIP